VSIPVPALYVSPASVLGRSDPVALSNKPTLQEVSLVSSTVTEVARVAVAALPVQEPDEPLAFPVSGPVSPVAVSIPVPALYVSPASVLGRSDPVALSNKPTLQEVSLVSSTVIEVAIVEVVLDCLGVEIKVLRNTPIINY
jgi:hypothetical protein